MPWSNTFFFFFFLARLSFSYVLLLGVSRNRFLIGFGIARSARYSLIVWLGVTYGRRVIRAWAQYLAGWSAVVIWSFIGLLIAAVIFGVWKYRHDQRRSGAAAPARAAS